MDTNALGLNLLGPAQGISGGMVETTGGTNPITNAGVKPLVEETAEEDVRAETSQLPSPSIVASRINSGEVKLTNGYYTRPNSATTPDMRAVVNYEGATCSTCGKAGVPMAADHNPSLVVEYYLTGKIDFSEINLNSSVRPQCYSCSAAQGGLLSAWSQSVKSGINPDAVKSN
jgi:hypothetical protein